MLGGVDDKQKKPEQEVSGFRKVLHRLARKQICGWTWHKEPAVRDFTPNQARQYARALLRLEAGDKREVHFIVTDGPRTGTHNSRGVPYKKNPHRIGKQNKVMKAFTDELRKNPQVTVTELGFQYEHLPSALQPMYAAWKKAEKNWKKQGAKPDEAPGRLYIDGASFSMLSEARDHLESVVANEMAMMDDNQRTEMRSRFEDGSVSLVTEGGTLLPRQKPWPGPQPSAGDAGAEALADVARDLYPQA